MPVCHASFQSPSPVWYLILAFRPAGIVLDLVIEGQLAEALLAAPLVATFSLCTDIVTLGSDNFLDFILCFVVEFGMLLFERCFWDPGFGFVFDYAVEKGAEIVRLIKKKLKLKGKSKIEEQAEREAAAAAAMKNRDAGVDYSTGVQTYSWGIFRLFWRCVWRRFYHYIHGYVHRIPRTYTASGVVWDQDTRHELLFVVWYH